MKAVSILIICTWLVSGFAAAHAQGDRRVVHLNDDGAGLVNPGMGWLFLHYDNNITEYDLELEPSDTVDDFPGLSAIYMRLAWSYIEPEEGKFNWSIVDTPAQRWIAKGKQIAFRFTCAERHANQPNATPEWVRRAGARGYFFTPRKGIDPLAARGESHHSGAGHTCGNPHKDIAIVWHGYMMSTWPWELASRRNSKKRFGCRAPRFQWAAATPFTSA